ncbi:MAG: right-handed parallel beta-helix repeat-containing protein [Aureliella sp.]
MYRRTRLGIISSPIIHSHASRIKISSIGCADLEISRNQIKDIGAGAIRIGHFYSWETDGTGQMTERGRQRKAAMPKGPHSQRITVADNEIAHCGQFTPEAVGIFVGDNADNQIIHNHIHDLIYSGISVGSIQDFGPCQAKGNIVEYNHVHDIGQGMLSDLAGIYTCSTPTSRIRFNVIHDVIRRDYGGWGIYADEGSHELLIQKNLVFRCQDGGLFAHHINGWTGEPRAKYYELRGWKRLDPHGWEVDDVEPSDRIGSPAIADHPTGTT